MNITLNSFTHIEMNFGHLEKQVKKEYEEILGFNTLYEEIYFKHGEYLLDMWKVIHILLLREPNGSFVHEICKRVIEFTHNKLFNFEMDYTPLLL